MRALNRLACVGEPMGQALNTLAVGLVSLSVGFVLQVIAG
jgi:hypothetical protein